MDTLLIKVRINKTDFIVDTIHNVFREVGDRGNIVLFEDCFRRGNKWQVLWNQRSNMVYGGMWDKLLPSYVCEVAVDLLDDGKSMRQTIAQTIHVLAARLQKLMGKTYSGAVAARQIENN